MSDEKEGPKLFVPTDRDRELFAMPPIQEQLPLVFPNTKYTFSYFDGVCNSCGCHITGPAFRGRLALVMDNVAQLEAIGGCSRCGMFTRYNYRLHDDGTISGRAGVEWARWAINPQQPAHKPFDPASDPNFSALPFWGKLAAALIWPFYIILAYTKWALAGLFGAQNDNEKR
jgi:hypothetical protein